MADHKTLYTFKSKDGDAVLLIVLDRFTQWLQAYACTSKEALTVSEGIQNFMGGAKAGHLYTDGAPEFGVAARELITCLMSMSLS